MGGLKTDAAIERWGSMRETTVQHFRMNKRTGLQFAIFGVIIPVAIYELSVLSAVRRDARPGAPATALRRAATARTRCAPAPRLFRASPPSCHLFPTEQRSGDERQGQAPVPLPLLLS